MRVEPELIPNELGNPMPRLKPTGQFPVDVWYAWAAPPNRLDRVVPPLPPDTIIRGILRSGAPAGPALVRNWIWHECGPQTIEQYQIVAPNQPA